jgi:hypothetical protein
METAQNARMVRCSILQASHAVPATEPLPRQKHAMVEKHVGLIREAPKQDVQIAWQFYRDRRPDLYAPLVAS